MDDKESIRIIRVLIQTAEQILEEKGEPHEKIEKAVRALIDHARRLYVDSCVKAAPEMSPDSDYGNECGEMFDYVFQHGSYPDE